MIAVADDRSPDASGRCPLGVGLSFASRVTVTLAFWCSKYGLRFRV